MLQSSSQQINSHYGLVACTLNFRLLVLFQAQALIHSLEMICSFRDSSQIYLETQPLDYSHRLPSPAATLQYLGVNVDPLVKNLDYHH